MPFCTPSAKVGREMKSHRSRWSNCLTHPPPPAALVTQRLGCNLTGNGADGRNGTFQINELLPGSHGIAPAEIPVSSWREWRTALSHLRAKYPRVPRRTD